MTFLSSTSSFSKLEFLYPPCCGVEEQMLIFSSSLTLDVWRVKGLWNPIPSLSIVLIWKSPACLKFGKISNFSVENLPQRKLWVGAANEMHALRQEFDSTELSVFICVVRGAMLSGKKWRSALWLNAMHSGYKRWLREFVPPYVFLLNPDYVNN